MYAAGRVVVAMKGGCFSRERYVKLARGQRRRGVCRKDRDMDRCRLARSGEERRRRADIKGMLWGGRGRRSGFFSREFDAVMRGWPL